MKSRFKAITALLALAMASGQAGAAIGSGDHDKSSLGAMPSGKEIADTQDLAIIGEGFLSGKTEPGPDVSAFTSTGNQASPSKVRDRSDVKSVSLVAHDQGRPVRLFPGLVLVASDADRPGNPAATTRLVQRKGSFAANFHPAAAGEPPVTVNAADPEPDSWAMLLAGLLGVGAIARRRMSS
jgi:MYXO-CTERM domain-containing protein